MPRRFASPTSSEARWSIRRRPPTRSRSPETSGRSRRASTCSSRWASRNWSGRGASRSRANRLARRPRSPSAFSKRKNNAIMVGAQHAVPLQQKEPIMLKIYYDQDADLKVLQGKTIAIIGFGSQGHAHALNLKDSGMDVLVGLREGTSWQKAERAGLKVLPTADAVKRADIVMILAPDEVQAGLYRAEIGPHLKKGAYLAFGHGFNIHFGQIVPPPSINVFMLAPKGPGHLVRSEFTKGSGVPCL